jgi:hypothetical protein
MGRAKCDTAFSPQLRLRPGGGFAGDRILARWRQRRGEYSQLPKAEVVLASFSSSTAVAFSLQLHNINSRFNQYTFMLSLEVVGPGGSLSTVLIATPYWRDASGVLAGCDGGIQLRLDGGGPSSSAGERLAAATAELIGFRQGWIQNL